MAQNNHTPVPFWLSVTLPDLGKWIKESNRIAAETKARRQATPNPGKRRKH